MKKWVLVALLMVVLNAGAQFKNDNVLYRTVEAEELCESLPDNGQFLLLDVRSKGEFEDTSFSVSLNIGRLKGATNIPVQELGNRLNELDDYRDLPVYVYCSHSQRSRRASKMLADSGFTRVHNINGGMTALHASGDDCLQTRFESGLAYKILTAPEVCDILEKRPDEYFILDVRPDSAWQGISRFEKENAIGHIEGAVHIARRDLSTQLEKIPNNRPILVTETGAVEAAHAATLLTKLGYADVSVLLEGMDRFLLYDPESLSCLQNHYVARPAYSLMNAFEFGRFVKQAKNYTVLDVRTIEEFENRHKDGFRNIGRIHDALHIPHTEIDGKMTMLKDKNKRIVVYAFSGGPEAFAVARKLTDAGYKNVTVLLGGIFSLRWTAANFREQAYLHDLVVDVPEENF
jgi:rhodanese-related sulfurtransferase